MTEDYKTPVGAAPPDWRGLCEELLDAYVWCIDEYMHDPASEDTLVQRARAALAKPEPEVAGPTDEELLRMAAEAIDPYDRIGIGEYEAETECAIEAYGSELIAFARAVLARWGRPAPVPAAPGEVKEVAAWLRAYCDEEFGPLSIDPDVSWLTRAADLLERQAAPVPVAFAERLPGAEDCDAEGRVWLYRPQTPILNPYWDLVKLDYIDIDPVMPTHWLPAHALPLPSGEVEA